jgi:8-oxo-dGTP pyrophosphatase MutT (NUDIX family)
MKPVNSIIESLRIALSHELPGIEAQLQMASSRRLVELSESLDMSKARKRAVLIPFYADAGQLNMIFMKRPDNTGVHSGQISFPGGRVEEEDQSYVDTALREAEEELSIPRNKVEVLGRITKLFIPPSNFLVQPVVGFLDELPELIPQEEEVAEILHIPLDFLLDEANVRRTNVKLYNGMQISTPAIIYEDRVIWGATAMILSELLHIMRKLPDLS